MMTSRAERLLSSLLPFRPFRLLFRSFSFSWHVPDFVCMLDDAFN
jgi:hypothetical protein